MLIIPEMANLHASDSSSSSMDDIEGQCLVEQREHQEAAQHGLQDGPHQIQADTRPDDVATGCADFDPIITSDDEASDEDEAYDVATGCADFDPIIISDDDASDEDKAYDVTTGCADLDPIIISDDDASDEDEAYGKNMEPCKF